LNNTPSIASPASPATTEIYTLYKGKLAEREIFLKKQLDEAYAARKAEDVEKIQKQIASERARLEEDREEEKERVRRAK